MQNSCFMRVSRKCSFISIFRFISCRYIYFAVIEDKYIQAHTFFITLSMLYSLIAANIFLNSIMHNGGCFANGALQWLDSQKFILNVLLVQESWHCCNYNLAGHLWNRFVYTYFVWITFVVYVSGYFFFFPLNVFAFPCITVDSHKSEC